MKYKIYKYINKELRKVSNGDKSQKQFDIVTKVLYYAKRKGRIFGFNHIVGQMDCDMSGTWMVPEFFNTIEECQDFIYKFHELHYGSKNKPEIVMTFNV